MPDLSALVLEASINANLQGLREDLKQGESELSKFGQGVSPSGLNKFIESASSKLATLGGRLSAAGQALAPVTNILRDTLDAASDLNESMSKVDVVFGGSSQIVKQFAETAATSLGQSKQQALEAAGTFGNLFTSLKIGQAPAAEMSTNLVKLASDLASFNNIDPGQALEKLRAGITGEAEPLKSLGIAMNETAMKAKALEMGLKPVGGQLTEQQKIAARYAIILEQSGNAQGDFARTADGAANAQRIFSAQLADLSSKFGQTFLPILGQGIQILSGLITKFQELPSGVQTAITVVASVAGALGAILPVIGGIVSGISAVLPLFGMLGSAIGALNPVVLAAIAVVAALTVAWKNNVGGIQEAVSGLASDLKAVFDKIISFVRAHADDFKRIWEGLKSVFGGFVSFVGNTLSGLIDVIRAILKAIQGDWSGAWDLLKSATAKIATGIVDLIIGIFNGLVSILAGVWGLIKENIFSAWQAIGNFFTTTVPNLLLGFLMWWSSLPGRLVGYLLELPGQIANVWGFIIGGALKFGADFVSGVVSFFAQLPGRLSAFASAAWDAVKSAFATGVAFAIQAATNLYKAVSEWVGKVPQVFSQIWDNVISYLSSLPGRLWDFAVGIGRSIYQGIKDGLDIHSPSGPEKELAKMDRGMQSLLVALSGNVKGPAETVGKNIYQAIKTNLDLVLTLTNDWLQQIGVTVEASLDLWRKLAPETQKSLAAQGLAFKKAQDEIDHIHLESAGKRKQIIEVEISTYQKFSTKVIEEVKKLGGTFKLIFPAMDGELFTFEDSLKDAAQAADKFADQATNAIEGFSKRAVADFERVSKEAPKPFKTLKETIEENLVLKMAEAELSTRSAISGMIRTFEELGIAAGKTGSELVEFVKGKLAEMPPKVRVAAEGMLKEWSDGLNKLPGALDSVVNKLLDALGKLDPALRAKFKGAASGVLEIVGALPGQIGEKLRAATSTVLDWVDRIDQILRGLHKIFKQVPDGLGEVFEKLGGLFKKSTKTISDAAKVTQQDIDRMGETGSKSIGGLANTTEESSGKMSKAFGVATSALGAFVSGMATASATGSKLLGSLTGGLQGALSGFAAGGPVGAIIGGIGGILGGLFGGKSAAQKQKEKLELERLKQDVQKGAQEVMQAAFETMQKALETFEKLADFTKVPRTLIGVFFRQMKVVITEFVALSKGWSVSMLDAAKRFAESIGPVLEAIGVGVEAFEKLSVFHGVPDKAIAAFGVALERAVALFIQIADRFENRAEKQAKKFAKRALEIVAVIGEGVSAFTALGDYKGIAVEVFDLFAKDLELAVNKMIVIADDINKRLLKQAARFAERAIAIVSVIREGVEAFKGINGYRSVAVEVFDQFLADLKLAVVKMQQVVDEIDTTMMAMASDFSQKSLAVFAAIKAGVEAFTLLRDYKAIPAEALDSVIADFKLAVKLLSDVLGLAVEGEALANAFRDAALKIAAALSDAGKALSGLTSQATQAATAGVATAVVATAATVSGAALTTQSLPAGASGKAGGSTTYITTETYGDINLNVNPENLRNIQDLLDMVDQARHQLRARNIGNPRRS